MLQSLKHLTLKPTVMNFGLLTTHCCYFQPNSLLLKSEVEQLLTSHCGRQNASVRQCAANNTINVITCWGKNKTSHLEGNLHTQWTNRFEWEQMCMTQPADEWMKACVSWELSVPWKEGAWNKTTAVMLTECRCFKHCYWGGPNRFWAQNLVIQSWFEK